jgi:SPP1 gp7 family putative phage head morphogenesis protein
MPDVDLGFAIGLQPEKAIDYFRAKGYAFSWRWEEVWQEAHAKAFTVAKAMKLDLLQDIRGACEKTLTKGNTLGEFRKELEPALKAKGWWGKALDENGKVVQLGSPHRLATIYRTNAQTAFMAGRYREQKEDAGSRPYWQYVAVMDRRTRPGHAALNGKAFRHDDPFWETHYPPLGWNCRCRVRALSQKNIKDRGLEAQSAEGNLTWEDRLISKSTGEMRPVSVFTDPKSGVRVATDPGWSYNPGKAWMEPFTPVEISGGMTSLEAAGKYVSGVVKDLNELPAKPLTPDLLLPLRQESGWDEKTYINLFLKEFGSEFGRPRIYTDVVGQPLTISEDLFFDRSKKTHKVFRADREKYLLMLADTIKDPAEVRLVWVAVEGKTRLSKRFIGLYSEESGRVGGFVVFDWLDDYWAGTTAFKPGRLDYLDRQREGLLIYEKKPST